MLTQGLRTWARLFRPSGCCTLPQLLLDRRFCSNLLCAFRAFIVRTVYKVADRILAHESRVEGLEQIGHQRGVGNTWIKPAIVIFRAEDHGHSVMNVGDQGVDL